MSKKEDDRDSNEPDYDEGKDRLEEGKRKQEKKKLALPNSDIGQSSLFR